VAAVAVEVEFWEEAQGGHGAVREGAHDWRRWCWQW
jgi:hypothetical protein